VLRAKGKRRLKAAGLDGCFLARGQVVQVVAVEKAKPTLTIVADRTADAILQKIQKRRLQVGPYTDTSPSLSPERKDNLTFLRLRDVESASGKMWMVSTVPRTSTASREPLDLFPLTPPSALFRDGLMWLLCHPRMAHRSSGPQQISDAVSVAGLYAAHSASPRAVLLVLGSQTDQSSGSLPDQVRGYLRATNVPLFVWATTPGPHVEAWGESDEVTSATAANKAMTRVFEHLKRQVIVWLDGAYLPNEIELGPDAEGLELAR
jgi:hypothetical protein